MNSRQRVQAALNHEAPDRAPVDLGSTDVTGIHACALDRLRKALGLESRMVKVFEPMMMLGLVEGDLLHEIGGDLIGIHPPVTLLGYWNRDWKPWTLPDGTRVLVGGGLAVTWGDDGTVYAYPQGDTAAAPSARMPSSGLYFDPIPRQADLTNHRFDARKDYRDQFALFTEEECLFFENESRMLYEQTGYALVGDFGQGGFGDFLLLPAPWLKSTGGIRKLDDWIMAHYDHPGYIHELFQLQTEVAVKNLEMYRQAVGDRISILVMSGTDFGAQNGPFISPYFYREFYKPYHTKLNDWVHRNTGWKISFHSCGSVEAFLEDFIEAGVEVINPVQFTAAGMSLRELKSKYADRLVFYGGGIDTQHTLPFGSPEQVAEETRENTRILSDGGGYICAAVHNIQAPTPVENMLAFFGSVQGA